MSNPPITRGFRTQKSSVSATRICVTFSIDGAGHKPVFFLNLDKVVNLTRNCMLTNKKANNILYVTLDISLNVRSDKIFSKNEWTRRGNVFVLVIN